MSTLPMRNRMQMLLVPALSCLLLSVQSASAATVTYAGAVWDDAGSQISQWRTVSTPKTMSSDNDNVYGSDAKLFYKVMGDYGSYIQYMASQTQADPQAGYAFVDHPDGVAADIQVRTTTSGAVTPGSLQDMFTFRVSAAPPASGFRVGVAFDGLNGAQYSPQEIRLTQTTGGSASAAQVVESYRNNTLDMVFFDVTGAALGDQFTVQGVAGAGGYATHQIVTWDKIVLPPVPLVGGNAIKVDFSAAGDSDGGSLSDWNRIGATAVNLPAGSVIRHGDARLLQNVTIGFANYVNGNANNDGASGNWPGTAADPYYVLAADDIYFHGSYSDLEVLFGGLDPSLGYNLRLYSLISNSGQSVERFVVVDGTGTHSVEATRAARWGASTLEDAGMVFEDLRADANGQIRFRLEDVSSPYYPLNAMVLEAVTLPEVPEPVSLTLFGLAACGLGKYLRRRR